MCHKECRVFSKQITWVQILALLLQRLVLGTMFNLSTLISLSAKLV